MKKALLVLGMLLLVLSACEKAKNKPPAKPNSNASIENVEESTKKIPNQIFEADPSVFHFIADWLSDTQIVYVEKRNSVYQVRYFDIESGENHLVYEDESFITDVIVHPSLNYLLIHTSKQSDAATVKIIKLDGTLQHEVEIASTELEIEWNSIDPQKIIFTAFHEDWSFDVFVFDGHSEDLSLVEVMDPFPKWLGENRIVAMKLQNHPLDGEEVQLINTETGNIELLPEKNIIYVDTFMDQLLLVQSPIDNLFTYRVKMRDGSIVNEWKLPAVSNYSEWIVPEVEWADVDHLLLMGTEKSAQLDELGAEYNLYSLENEELKKKVDSLDNEPLKCSPSGQRCLIGYTSEELIELETGEKYFWINLKK